MATDDDIDAANRLLMSKEMTDHLKTFMPADQAAGAMVNGTMLLIAALATEAPVTGLTNKAEAYATISFVLATILKNRANGRKLTNEAKRKRMATIVTLMRDAADRLEAVLLNGGNIDAN